MTLFHLKDYKQKAYLPFFKVSLPFFLKRFSLFQFKLNYLVSVISGNRLKLPDDCNFCTFNRTSYNNTAQRVHEFIFVKFL